MTTIKNEVLIVKRYDHQSIQIIQEQKSISAMNKSVAVQAMSTLLTDLTAYLRATSELTHMHASSIYHMSEAGLKQDL